MRLAQILSFERQRRPATDLNRENGGQRVLGHFAFALSPSSTRRRMASGRVRPGSFCFDIHAAIARDCSGSTRKCTDSAPVEGLPLDFRVRVIALLINIVYHKVEPRGSSQLPPRL